MAGGSFFYSQYRFAAIIHTAVNGQSFTKFKQFIEGDFQGGGNVNECI